MNGRLAPALPARPVASPAKRQLTRIRCVCGVTADRGRMIQCQARSCSQAHPNCEPHSTLMTRPWGLMPTATDASCTRTHLSMGTNTLHSGLQVNLLQKAPLSRVD